MEGTAICSAAALRHKMDEAKKMFKSDFFKNKMVRRPLHCLHVGSKKYWRCCRMTTDLQIKAVLLFKQAVCTASNSGK